MLLEVFLVCTLLASSAVLVLVRKAKTEQAERDKEARIQRAIRAYEQGKKKDTNVYMPVEESGRR